VTENNLFDIKNNKPDRPAHHQLRLAAREPATFA